ncbi:hypothetical protein PR048_031175 [Dryococelus australis]|uniref:PiggyBac transposable element-derived protein domain-containing protein n=1 Tax=Dryococelus australis TaxID=614101 RepID=A0ABQ9G8K9_9NEOP|nr:hypothetical protein PR048_031175 [Dryococelus australis]
MYEVRPLYDSFRKQCLQLPMIPLKAVLSVEQYLQSKPCKWGIKILILCGESGICYDFLIYQASPTEIDPACIKQFGKPTEGRALLNRFASPPLLSDKEMAKNVRGCTDEVCHDNKSAVIDSNFLGVGKKDEVERLDKKGKKNIEVERPEVIKSYNKNMGTGSVSKPLYRIMTKSRKWTLRMLFHVVDLAIVNSWLEYRQDAKTAGIPQAHVLDLLHFRMRLTNSQQTS